jgi:hypothetical protein
MQKDKINVVTTNIRNKNVSDLNSAGEQMDSRGAINLEVTK